MRKIKLIKVGQECPNSAKCQIKKDGFCCHQGKRHKAQYQCFNLR